MGKTPVSCRGRHSSAAILVCPSVRRSIMRRGFEFSVCRRLGWVMFAILVICRSKGRSSGSFPSGLVFISAGITGRTFFLRKSSFRMRVYISSAPMSGFCSINSSVTGTYLVRSASFNAFMRQNFLFAPLVIKLRFYSSTKAFEIPHFLSKTQSYTTFLVDFLLSFSTKGSLYLK